MLLADHVVPDVKPRDVSNTATTLANTAAAAAATGDGSFREDILDIIDQLSQTTSDRLHRPQYDASDDIFPL